MLTLPPGIKSLVFITVCCFVTNSIVFKCCETILCNPNIIMNLCHTWNRLACGSNGTGFSLLLSSERLELSGSKSICQLSLFNCGDSTQQMILQRKIKLHKLSVIFVTSLAPHNISGIPSLVLSLSDLVEALLIYIC